MRAEEREAYPVDIEEVDVCGTEFLETLLNGDVHRLQVVPCPSRVLLDVCPSALRVGRVLSSNAQ